jgi:hypothetical protein
MQAQNNGSKFLVSRFFSAKNNIIIHSMISISVTHAFKAKTNLDVIDNNSCAL